MNEKRPHPSRICALGLLLTLLLTLLPACEGRPAEPLVLPDNLTLDHTAPVPDDPDVTPDPTAPLSALVALSLRDGTDAPHIPAYVKREVTAYARGEKGREPRFPLPAARGSGVRALDALTASVPVKWLDPLTPDTAATAPRYGAFGDFFAYFGDGWNADWKDGIVTSAPQWSGDSTRGWAWANHEHLWGTPPGPTSAPTREHLTLAKFLRAGGVLSNDVNATKWHTKDIDTHLRFTKRQFGGSWFRLERDDKTRAWRAVRHPDAVRYDATSDTRVAITGHETVRRGHADDGTELPAGVAAGIMGDCSGGQSPWGTIFTAEENVQAYYGDLEHGWTFDQKRLAYPPGQPIRFEIEPSPAGLFGAMSNASERHDRDFYGWMSEIDPGARPDHYYRSLRDEGDGRGHRKIGKMGRARWENCTVAVDDDWRLFDGQPIVLYGGDDRRGGRVYKYVTREPYRRTMTRAETRALLDDGVLYVAHFAGLDNRNGRTLRATGDLPTDDTPGRGRWIRLDLASDDIAPNADALGRPTMTVGNALRDLEWNGMGGFTDDATVRMALFTASNKIGVMELNRPEDVEWNPRDPSGRARVYIAFTGHGRRVALDQRGVLFDPAEHARKSPRRTGHGTIVALEESDPTAPASSRTFTYRTAFVGSHKDANFAAAHPDNLLIDRDGGVWFTTDGNPAANRAADAVYYLDLDPAHRAGAAGITSATYGRAFRVAAVPRGAEATGPGFTPDMTTLFVHAQHPTESWPPRDGSADSSRRYQFTYRVTVPAPPAGTKRLRVWVPLPMDDAGVQSVSNLTIRPATCRVTRDPTYANRMAFLEIADPTGPTEISWTADIVRRRDVGQGGLPMNDRFRQANRQIPLDGKAAELAQTLGILDRQIPLAERAKRIYDDVLNSMDYDKSTPGYGNGDFDRAVEVCKGNCTDFHARFIGVGRAGAIPVRFTIGIPLKAGKSSYNSYHCWAHWYDGTHWQPVDISEADKVVDKDPAKAEWFFGHLDSDRISLTVGRDVTLAPAQAGPPLNYFVFPYAEADGAPVAMNKKEHWKFTWVDQ